MTGNVAVITGITGQDGAYLTRFLLKKNYTVFGVLSRDAALNSFTNFEKLGVNQDDIKKIHLEDLAGILADGNELYNLAGQSSVGRSWDLPADTFEANVQFYLKVLKSCEGKKVKILQASSAEMYGDKPDQELQEDMHMDPLSPYALSKYTAHRLGKMFRETEKYWITNAIFFNHESPLRDNRFVLRKIIDGVRDISEGKSILLELGNLEISRDWGFAEDYVEVMWQLLQQPEPMDINVATGKTVKLKEVVKAVFNHFGVSDFEKYIRINPDFLRSNDIASFQADVTKLSKLGITLESIQNNIGRLI